MSQGMNASEIATLEQPSAPSNPEHGLPESFGEGIPGKFLFWIAVAFSAFQIVTAFGIPLDRPIFGNVSALYLTGAAFVAWA
ncbi:MAG TPA: TRAP transporter permease, partial [Microvirga sp.]|nr:TRAP transporter permease [Microvirga sp.]